MVLGVEQIQSKKKRELLSLWYATCFLLTFLLNDRIGPREALFPGFHHVQTMFCPLECHWG